MKTCNSFFYCSFKYQSGTSTGDYKSAGCSYHDYCDYQLPRDSRWQNNVKPYCRCGGTPNTIKRCSVCGLLQYEETK